jgi:hypothetical protein
MCRSEGAGALTLSFVISHQPQIFRPMLIFGTTRNRSIDLDPRSFLGGKEQVFATFQNVAFFLIRNRQAALATGSYTSLKPGISLQIMQPFTSNLATGLPKTKPRNIDFRPNTQGSLAWLVAGRNMLGGGSLWYWTDCNHTNFVRGCPFSSTGCPGQLLDRSSVISGELQAGENSICLSLTWVLLGPPRRPPWNAFVHFRFSYSIDVLHLHSLSAVTQGIYLGDRDLARSHGPISRLTLTETIRKRLKILTGTGGAVCKGATPSVEQPG